MKNIKWIKYWFAIVFLGIFCVASFNFIIDPGKIYLNKIISSKNITNISEILTNSKYGINADNLNERLVKTDIAKNANSKCAVIGSSHVMQISSIRETGNIGKQCENLINLGVSGGCLEDIAIMSYFLSKNKNRPKIIIIGVDPWGLKFNADKRFGAYKDILNKMNIELNSEKNSNEDYLSEYILNLINLEYTKNSLKEFKNNMHNENKIIVVNNPFNLELGIKTKVLLPDASLVYGSDFIEKSKHSNIPKGGGNYKIYGEPYNKKAILYLKQIIKYLEKNGIEVRLLMTPYHPNVFKKGETKPVKFMKIIEAKNKEIAKELNLKIYGSYFPDKVGCKEDEFYDYMHPANKCLNRIDFSR